MTPSDRIFARLMKHEGGYNDIPEDKGGATKFGVSLATLERLRRDHRQFYEDLLHHGSVPTNQDIFDLTIEQAKAIFERFYFGPFADLPVPLPVLAEVVDAAYNHGPRTAAQFLQTAINKTLGYNKSDQRRLRVDGKIGPLTRKALARVMPRRDDDILISKYRGVREARYFRIVKKDPTQNIFIRGWILRVRSPKFL